MGVVPASSVLTLIQEAAVESDVVLPSDTDCRAWREVPLETRHQRAGKHIRGLGSLQRADHPLQDLLL